MGVAKESAYQVPDLRTAGILLCDQRTVYVRTAVLGVSDIAFAFQNADRRKNRVIGKGGISRKGIENLLNGAGSLLPQHLHDAQFSFCQCL